MVDVKVIDTTKTGPVLAIDPGAWLDLIEIPTCQQPTASGRSCMLPAGHPGDTHARFVLALVTVEPARTSSVRDLEAEMIDAAMGGD